MGDQGGQVHDFDRCPLTQTFPTSWEFRLFWLSYLHNALRSNAVALITITIYYLSWFLGVRDSGPVGMAYLCPMMPGPQLCGSKAGGRSI